MKACTDVTEWLPDSEADNLFHLHDLGHIPNLSNSSFEK